MNLTIKLMSVSLLLGTLATATTLATVNGKKITSEEVNKIQNGGEVTTGIVAKYDFEGSNPLADKTGNGHDASITNTPTVVEW